MMRKDTLIAVIVVLLCAVGAVSGCGDAATRAVLDRADALMEAHPDSALALLDSLDRDALVTRADRARYALLKSMALDKNYVDTTDFSILQPAIDYYADHGSVDDKVRTHYYQGRIYQNCGDRASALAAFTCATDSTMPVSDSLTLMRALIGKAQILHDLYDFQGYIDCHSQSAEIARGVNRLDYEFVNLVNVLNGGIVLNDSIVATQAMHSLDKLENLTENQKNTLREYRYSYIVNFGSDKEINAILGAGKDEWSFDFDLVRAYCKVGNYITAKHILDSIASCGMPYNTLKFRAILYDVQKNLGNYQEALNIYEAYAAYSDSISHVRYSNQIKFIEEKHRIEAKALEEKHKRKQMIYYCLLSILGLSVIILVIAILSHKRKTRLKLAVQKVLAVQFEMERLKNESRDISIEHNNLKQRHDQKIAETQELAGLVEKLKRELDDFKKKIEEPDRLPDIVQTAVQMRVEMLNTLLAANISNNPRLEQVWFDNVDKLIENTNDFMNSNRCAFQAMHPDFIRYLESHNLNEEEINYVCLYALGLNGKQVGEYLKRPSHIKMSSNIRKKLGMDIHDTNLRKYVLRFLNKDGNQ